MPSPLLIWSSESCHHFLYLELSSFPKPQILDSSKLKEFADDNFNFVENGNKVFKQVENNVGKGEIAHWTLRLYKAVNQHFLNRFFPRVV